MERGRGGWAQKKATVIPHICFYALTGQLHQRSPTAKGSVASKRLGKRFRCALTAEY